MVNQSGSVPSGGMDTPGNDGQSDTLGVGVGSFGGDGVAGMQGRLVLSGGEMEGQSVGGSVGVGSFGGVGVGRQVGSGNFGRDGSVGAAADCDGACPTPVWHAEFLALWSQAG